MRWIDVPLVVAVRLLQVIPVLRDYYSYLVPDTWYWPRCQALFFKNDFQITQK